MIKNLHNFRVGDPARCIDDQYAANSLQNGKCYTILEVSPTEVQVQNEFNVRFWYSPRRFDFPLVEYRKLKHLTLLVKWDYFREKRIDSLNKN